MKPALPRHFGTRGIGGYALVGDVGGDLGVDLFEVEDVAIRDPVDGAIVGQPTDTDTARHGAALDVGTAPWA